MICWTERTDTGLFSSEDLGNLIVTTTLVVSTTVACSGQRRGWFPIGRQQWWACRDLWSFSDDSRRFAENGPRNQNQWPWHYAERPHAIKTNKNDRADPKNGRTIWNTFKFAGKVGQKHAYCKSFACSYKQGQRYEGMKSSCATSTMLSQVLAGRKIQQIFPSLAENCPGVTATHVA